MKRDSPNIYNVVLKRDALEYVILFSKKGNEKIKNLVVWNHSEARVRLAFKRHPDNNYQEIGAKEFRRYTGESIPDTLWACRVTETIEPELKIEEHYGDIEISPSSSLHGKNWDSGEPTGITATPSGNSRNLLDVYIPEGAGNLSLDAGDMLLRLREVVLDVDDLTFVPDTITSDAISQVEETAIGVRKRFSKTYGFKLESGVGVYGFGKWVYSPVSHIDVSELNFIMFMISFNKTGVVAEGETLSYDMVANDPTMRIELEDENGYTKYWDFYRRDMNDEFVTLIANLRSYPTGGTNISLFDNDNVTDIRLFIYPSLKFYTQFSGSSGTVCYIEKCIMGNIGLQVNTEIRDIEVDVEVTGVMSTEVIEERFVGDGISDTFQLNNIAGRLLESQIYKNGTWGEIATTLSSDGLSITYTGGAPDLNDPLRIVYSLKYGGGTNVALTDTDSIFTNQVINSSSDFDSSVVENSKFRSGSIRFRFHTASVGGMPSNVRLTLLTGDDTVLGIENYWDCYSINDGDIITLNVGEDMATTHLKIRINNNDSNPTVNYCSVDAKIFVKS